MTALDWVLVALVLGSVLLAAAQGFFFEIFSLSGTVLGFVAALWAYPRTANWFLPYVSSAWVAELAGFLTIFLAAVLLAGMAGRLARWAIKLAGLQWVDRILGAALGLVGGLILATGLVLALAAFPPGSKELARSRFGPYLLVVARAAVWIAPAELRGRFHDGLAVLRGWRRGEPDLVRSGAAGEQAPQP